MAMKLPLTVNRHYPFYLGLGAALLVLLAGVWFAPWTAAVLAANAFFGVFLALSLAGMWNRSAQTLKEHAASEDEPVWIIFIVTLATAILGIAALFLALNAEPNPHPFDLGLALMAVLLGWMTIHALCALHYAREYWQPDDESEAGELQGGLDFPQTESPEGVDFLYFSYVIGMTAQTADVDTTTPAMRRIVLIHGLTSFFFNTVLVAAAVNAAVSLGGGGG